MIVDLDLSYPYNSLAANNLLAKSEKSDFGDNSTVGEVNTPDFDPETFGERINAADEYKPSEINFSQSI